jgi:hypothetical protein
MEDPEAVRAMVGIHVETFMPNGSSPPGSLARYLGMFNHQVYPFSTALVFFNRLAIDNRCQLLAPSQMLQTLESRNITRNQLSYLLALDTNNRIK